MLMMEKMMVLMMGSGDGGDDVDGDGGDDICFSFTKTTRWKAATRSTSGNGPNKEYTCDNETTKTHAFAKQRKCLLCRANEESTCGNETKTALAGTINEHTCGKESENVLVAQAAEAIFLHYLTEQPMNILPTDGSVHLAGSTFIQAEPCFICGVNTDQVSSNFAGPRIVMMYMYMYVYVCICMCMYMSF